MVTQELLTYIQSELQKGIGISDISAMLTTQGWAMADVQIAFKQLGIQNSTLTQTEASPQQRKPVYQNNWFIDLCLFIFWPLGLILMWRFATWKRGLKIGVTIFFLISLLPLILIFSLIFGLKSASIITNNNINSQPINTSKNYACKANDSQWSTCTSNKFHVSFAYPTSWSYGDIGKDGIGFSPINKKIGDNFVISFTPSEWGTIQEAKQFVDGFAIPKKQIQVNGFYATQDEIKDKNTDLFTVDILKDNISYQFIGFLEKLPVLSSSVSIDDGRSIIIHMANSFMVGGRINQTH